MDSFLPTDQVSTETGQVQGDPMGVARKVGQHGLGSTERRLGVNHPFELAYRRKMSVEGVAVCQRRQIVEEAEAAGVVGRDKLLEEQSAEQAREYAHRQEEVRPARYPTLPVE